MTKNEHDARAQMLANAAHARKAAGELPDGDLAPAPSREKRMRLLVGAEMLDATAAYLYWRAQPKRRRPKAPQAA
jgi:hypothetical protein